VRDGPGFARRRGELFGQGRAKRPVERHVGHDASAEKCGGAKVGAVHHLVGHEEIPGSHVPAQTADGPDADDPFDAQGFQSVNIRPRRDLGRQQAVAPAVAGQKGAAHARQGAEDNLIGGEPERRAGPRAAQAFDAREVVETAAADNRNGHAFAAHSRAGLARRSNSRIFSSISGTRKGLRK
jgi:hypothetical protein